jgi:hypothetical protein
MVYSFFPEILVSALEDAPPGAWFNASALKFVQSFVPPET